MASSDLRGKYLPLYELLTCSGPKSKDLAPAEPGALGAVGRHSAGHPSVAAMTKGFDGGVVYKEMETKHFGLHHKSLKAQFITA